MGIWLYPAIFVILLLCAYSYYVIVRVAKETEKLDSNEDVPIHEAIKDHPFILNPIILMYLIVGIFMGMMIFYYWATSSAY